MKRIVITILIITAFVIIGLVFSYFTSDYSMYIPTSIIIGLLISIIVNRYKK